MAAPTPPETTSETRRRFRDWAADPLPEPPKPKNVVAVVVAVLLAVGLGLATPFGWIILSMSILAAGISMLVMARNGVSPAGLTALCLGLYGIVFRLKAIKDDEEAFYVSIGVVILFAVIGGIVAATTHDRPYWKGWIIAVLIFFLIGAVGVALFT